MTFKTRHEQAHKYWWGNKYLLLLTAAASIATLAMQILEITKG